MSQKKPIDQTAAPAEEQIMSGGRMLFTGPDYLRDHRVKVEEEHRKDFIYDESKRSDHKMTLDQTGRSLERTLTVYFGRRPL